MRLTCPCLSVRKNSAIVTLEDAFDYGQCCLLENAFLKTAWLKGKIKAENSLLFSNFFWVVHKDFSPFRHNSDDRFVFFFLLLGRHRSASDSDFDTLAFSHQIFVI